MTGCSDARVADLEREIAELRQQLSEREAELTEAQVQLAATSDILGVINASPGDLAPVFDAIVEKAVTLCGADEGALRTFDGAFFHPAAISGADQGAVELIRRRGPIPPNGAFARIARGERVVNILDCREHEDFRNDPAARERIEVRGIRTWLAVALHKDEVVLGALMVHCKEVRPFTDKQIALLQNFAAQAVIAMENARLLTETREALEQQTATAEVLQVINSSPGDLAPVFDAILEKAHRICSLTRGSLVTYDGSNFTNVARRGVGEQVAAVMSQARSVPWTAQRALLRGDRLVHIPDLSAYSWDPDDTVIRPYMEASKLRAGLLVPLRKDGVLLGYISGYRDEAGPFSEKEIALLENFAAQAVIAMENARLLGELRARTDEVAAWNRELEDRVAAQLGELERVGRLKRFLAPQLAEALVAGGDEGILETHRRDIVVVFCDLRGFTAFAETAEPEEVLELLREYHGALGPIVGASEGTLDHFSGDGIMVFFNDPVPVPDAAERAVRMAIEMREAMTRLQGQWRRQGREIGFGAGIARGYATLGQIGFADRVDYTAIGTVCNLAARLCAEAKDGQILISRRVAAAVEEIVRLAEIGDLALKGLMQAVAVYNVVGDITAVPAAQDRAANLP